MRLFDVLMDVLMPVLLGLACFGFGMFLSNGMLSVGLVSFVVGCAVGVIVWND